MTTRDWLKREFPPLFIIAALSVGFMWRVTLAGRAMVPGDLLLIMEPWKHHAREFPEFSRAANPILDAIQQFYPWRKFAGESLREGVIPLWNPHMLSGTPFVANNQSAVFYPETWLHALMPTDHALGWASALAFFIAGALMYWFLRVLALRRLAALLGGVAFMFNGFIIGWLCFPSFRSVPIWLPGMLVAFELTLRRRNVGWAGLCALFVGLQYLAGNLHISIICLGLFAMYVIFRLVETWFGGERQLALRSFAACVGAVAVGSLMAGIQLIPTVELALLSHRAGGFSYASHIANAMSWQHLLTALLPDVFGNPVDYNHWGAELGGVYRAYTETAWYVGVGPILLAPAAVLFGRGRSRWFWVGIALLGIALAFGTPVYALFYYLVPGAKSLSGVTRQILMSSTALSVLGAIGLHGLLEACEGDSRPRVARYATMAGATIGLVGLVGGALVWVRTGGLEEALPGVGAYTTLQIARFAVPCGLSAGLVALATKRSRAIGLGLVALLAADLYIFTDKFTPAVDPAYLHVRTDVVDTIAQDPDYPRVLALGEDGVRRMSPNTPMIFGLHDVQGSDSLKIGDYDRLIHAIDATVLGFPQPDPSHPVIDMLSVRYIQSAADLGGVDGLRLVSSREGWLYRNDDALPRARVARAARVVADEEAAFSVVSSPEFDPAGAVILTGADRSDAVGLPAGDCRISEYAQNRVVVEGDFEPGQLLVVAESYFPGWHAFAAGEESPILRANFVQRAAEITRSCRSVQMVYDPASFRAGAFVSLLAVTAIAIVGGYSLARRRTRND